MAAVTRASETCGLFALATGAAGRAGADSSQEQSCASRRDGASEGEPVREHGQAHGWPALQQQQARGTPSPATSNGGGNTPVNWLPKSKNANPAQRMVELSAWMRPVSTWRGAVPDEMRGDTNRSRMKADRETEETSEHVSRLHHDDDEGASDVDKRLKHQEVAFVEHDHASEARESAGVGAECRRASHSASKEGFGR